MPSRFDQFSPAATLYNCRSHDSTLLADARRCAAAAKHAGHLYDVVPGAGRRSDALRADAAARLQRTRRAAADSGAASGRAALSRLWRHVRPADRCAWPEQPCRNHRRARRADPIVDRRRLRPGGPCTREERDDRLQGRPGAGHGRGLQPGRPRRVVPLIPPPRCLQGRNRHGRSDRGRAD
jgi:hypothetical protein